MDKACDDYHRFHEIIVRSDLAHVVRLSNNLINKKKSFDAVLNDTSKDISEDIQEQKQVS